jgi:integrase
MIVGSQIAWPMAMSCADASCLADELIGDNYTPTHLAAIDCDGGSPRRSDWPERDRALLLTAVLAGLRADELIGVDVGDIRVADGGGVIHVRGKGTKDRRIPVKQSLLEVLERYLNSRAARFAAKTERRTPSAGLASWPLTAALFVGSDGERITRGVLQYRVLQAFKKAASGLDPACWTRLIPDFSRGKRDDPTRWQGRITPKSSAGMQSSCTA